MLKIKKVILTILNLLMDGVSSMPLLIRSIYYLSLFISLKQDSKST